MFKDKWVILGLKTMGYLLLMFAVLSIFDVWKEWSDKRTDARDVEHAKSQLEATGYDVKRETLKNGVPAKASPSNATGPVYDCNSAQSVQAGFRAGKVHYLGNADSYTMSGCLWIEADQEMGDISGQNFLIEFPLEKNSKRLDSSLYSKSPSEKNPDPTAFWNEISNNPNYQSKAVRVLVMKDGFVTITKKGN